MRLALVPRTTEFFDLFTQAGENVLSAAQLLEDRVRDVPDSEVAHERIKDLETTGDSLTAQLIELLNTQYVTPFEREDIYGLATRLDDVVDHIEHVSDLLDLYKIDAPMEQATAQARVLGSAARELAAAVGSLRSLRTVHRPLAELKRYEDEGDRLVRDAIAALFEPDDVDPRVIIRWKDVFEALEDAIDACESAGHLVGNVALKNA